MYAGRLSFTECSLVESFDIQTMFRVHAKFVIVAWVACLLTACAPSAVIAAPVASSQPTAGDVLELPNDSFNVPVDPAVSREGGPALVLNSTLKPLQDMPAWRGVDFARFVGKRVRFSAYVKTAGKMTNFAGLCLHAYIEGRKTCVFDDMIGRALTGPSDWTKLEIVADINLPANGLAVGAHIKGSGQLWMDGARLEVVGTDVPTTDDSTNHIYTDLASNYTVRLDPGAMRNGHPTVCITSSTKPTNSWAWYGVYNHFPDAYLGKRIRITGWAKCENVTKGGRIACWAITPEGKVVCLDNEKERVSIKGTTDWKKYEITAKVPAALDHLDPGFNLFGNGKLWVDELRYEVIPDDDSSL